MKNLLIVLVSLTASLAHANVDPSKGEKILCTVTQVVNGVAQRIPMPVADSQYQEGSFILTASTADYEAKADVAPFREDVDWQITDKKTNLTTWTLGQPLKRGPYATNHVVLFKDRTHMNQDNFQAACRIFDPSVEKQ